MNEKLIVTIYGSGCKKCQDLKNNAARAIKESKKEIELEYITDLDTIAECGVISTPALSVYGKIVSSGKVLKPKEIVKYL